MGQGEKGLTWSLLLALCSSTIGSSFIFGYTIAVMNAPAEHIKAWIRNQSYPSIHHTTPTDGTMTELWCWIMAIMTLCGTIGGLLCGYLADKLGRKGAMMATDALTLTGALLMGVSKATNVYFVLLAGRIIVGISCGICSALPAIYLTEIAPVRLRGTMGNLNTFVVILAVFVAQVLGQPQLLGTETLWPLLLAFTGAPAIFQLITLPFCAESPKYLLAIKKDPKAARAALVQLRQTESVEDELDNMLDDGAKMIEDESLEHVQSISFWWGISICLVNHLVQQGSGTTAVLFFSATIFRDQARMSSEQAVGATLGIGAVFILASIVSTAIIERVGRRPLMLSGVAGICVFDVMIFVTLHLLAIDYQQYNAAAYAAVIFVYLFIFAYALGPSSIPWFYTSELFEPSRRGRANMIATTVNWFSAFLIGYTFLPLKERMSEYVFLLYAAMTATGFLYLYFFAPETKGRQCREVAEELEARMPRCIR